VRCSRHAQPHHCCVARPEAGLVANRLAVRGCPPGLFPARSQGGTAPGMGEPGGDVKAAGQAAGNAEGAQAAVSGVTARLMTLSAHVR
jgi:hypothetical protein